MQGLVADALDPAKRTPDPARKAADADLATLRTRFEDALKTLRASHGASQKGFKAWLKPRGDTLYDLPWYMCVGAPGAGKTTALAHSGLRFPLADRLGAQVVGGVGGTRNCDWWPTTPCCSTPPDVSPRRIVTKEADRGAWLGFLGLLRNTVRDVRSTA